MPLGTDFNDVDDAVCPICGSPIDYCQGHGSDDPATVHAIDGDHECEDCHQAAEYQFTVEMSNGHATPNRVAHWKLCYDHAEQVRFGFEAGNFGDNTFLMNVVRINNPNIIS